MNVKVVLLTAVLLLNSGCATMRRHPIITGAVIGLAAGATVAIVTTHNCPNFYVENGKRVPYSGTPPCPK